MWRLITVWDDGEISVWALDYKWADALYAAAWLTEHYPGSVSTIIQDGNFLATTAPTITNTSEVNSVGA